MIHIMFRFARRFIPAAILCTIVGSCDNGKTEKTCDTYTAQNHIFEFLDAADWCGFMKESTPDQKGDTINEAINNGCCFIASDECIKEMSLSDTVCPLPQCQYEMHIAKCDTIESLYI